MEKTTLYSALKNIEGLQSTRVRQEIIENYRGNPLLKQVIKGESSLENICIELSAPVEGWRAQVPHQKDKTHNEKVAYLEELIPADFYKRGFYFPDNLTTCISYSLLSMGGFTLATKMPTESMPQVIVSIYSMGGLLLTSFYMAIMAGLNSMGGKGIKQSIRKATYLDFAIKEYLAKK